MIIFHIGLNGFNGCCTFGIRKIRQIRCLNKNSADAMNIFSHRI